MGTTQSVLNYTSTNTPGHERLRSHRHRTYIVCIHSAPTSCADISLRHRTDTNICHTEATCRVSISELFSSYSRPWSLSCWPPQQSQNCRIQGLLTGDCRRSAKTTTTLCSLVRQGLARPP